MQQVPSNNFWKNLQKLDGLAAFHGGTGTEN